jgi:hypothetical protein
MTKAISVQCTAISKQTKQQCKAKAIPGGTVCRWHGGAAGQVKAKAAVRAELIGWGLGDATVDPGEVLLRLVTQSAARAERYAMLLEEAYEAAEWLKQAHDAGAEIQAPGEELAHTAKRHAVILIGFSTPVALLPSLAIPTELRRTLGFT